MSAVTAQRGRSPFRFRAFSLLLGGQALSSIGDQFYAVALPIALLAHPHLRTGGPTVLGTLLAGYGAARALTLLLGGWAADWAGSRLVMLASDILRAVAVAWLAALLDSPRPALTGLVAAVVILGIGDGFFSPASFAIMPSLVPSGDLQRANSVYMAAGQAISAIGPLLGGVLVSALDPSVALAADSISFLVSTASLMLIGLYRRSHPQPHAARASPDEQRSLDGERIGLWALWRTSPLLRALLLAAAAASAVFGGITEVAVPTLATRTLHAGADGYGIMLAGLSAGTFAGALASAKIGKTRTGPSAVSCISLAGLAVALLALTPLLPGEPALALATTLLALTGGGLGAGNSLLMTVFQLRLPERILGRAMSLMLLANFGLYPVSTLLSGLLVPRLGVTATLIGAGLFLSATALATLTSRSVRVVSLLHPSTESASTA